MLARLAMRVGERDPEAGAEGGRQGAIVFDSSCPVSTLFNLSSQRKD